jgi:hypothetical protein
MRPSKMVDIEMKKEFQNQQKIRENQKEKESEKFKDFEKMGKRKKLEEDLRKVENFVKQDQIDAKIWAQQMRKLREGKEKEELKKFSKGKNEDDEF